MSKSEKTITEEKLDRARERLRRLQREVEQQKLFIARLEYAQQAEAAQKLK
jgi:hypothetical protein